MRASQRAPRTPKLGRQDRPAGRCEYDVLEDVLTGQCGSKGEELECELGKKEDRQERAYEVDKEEQCYQRQKDVEQESEAECVFRRIRTPIPAQSGQSFRANRTPSERSDAGREFYLEFLSS